MNFLAEVILIYIIGNNVDEVKRGHLKSVKIRLELFAFI